MKRTFCARKWWMIAAVVGVVCLVILLIYLLIKFWIDYLSLVTQFDKSLILERSFLEAPTQRFLVYPRRGSARSYLVQRCTASLLDGNEVNSECSGCPHHAQIRIIDDRNGKGSSVIAVGQRSDWRAAIFWFTNQSSQLSRIFEETMAD